MIVATGVCFAQPHTLWRLARFPLLSNDKRYHLIRQTSQQDAHAMPPMWSQSISHSEENLCFLRLSFSKNSKL
ncbi:hypothetical protein P879_11100 [Paragonimus westermani]|uniref:Uncharacterized protein n=1 Tax=Paragonimus westermani TaxID=34504 RepID=A0A8T0D8W7_9TREM|nr:hypothetical protein P879_11100 [Paragonimus westermani]